MHESEIDLLFAFSSKSNKVLRRYETVDDALAGRSRQNGTRLSLRNRNLYCALEPGELEPGGVNVSALEDIVDRAIEYTNKILNTMPSYRSSAIEGLRKLRIALADKTPDDPAIARLDAYLESLGSDGDPS